MAKYKLYSGYAGSSHDDYRGVISVPKGVDVGDWLENNGYGEAYNYTWKKVAYNQKVKKKRTIKKTTSNSNKRTIKIAVKGLRYWVNTGYGWRSITKFIANDRYFRRLKVVSKRFEKGGKIYTLR